MDFDTMSLEDLFAAADAVPDHRDEAEIAEMQQQIREAVADLFEAIGDEDKDE